MIGWLIFDVCNPLQHEALEQAQLKGHRDMHRESHPPNHAPVSDDKRAAARPHLHGQKRSAVVLAGGLSLRFGSNKALQVLAGKPLIRRVVERVSEVTEEVVVVVARGESEAEYYTVLPSGVRVVNDDRKGKNPLVGMARGLGNAECEYAAVLACDLPFVNSEVIELLFQRASNADAAIPRWNRRRIEPLQAVYRRVPTLEATLETLTPTDFSIEDMIRKLNRIAYVSVEDEIATIDRELSTFFNINTREDMKVAEKMLAEKGAFLKSSKAKRDG